MLCLKLIKIMIINNQVKFNNLVNFFILKSPSIFFIYWISIRLLLLFLISDSDSFVLNFKNTFVADRKNTYDCIVVYHVFIAYKSHTKIQYINLLQFIRGIHLIDPQIN